MTRSHDILMVLFLSFLLPAFAYTASASPIFPVPKEMKMKGGTFSITESTTILLPSKPSERDLFLARLLMAELSERCFMPVVMSETGELPVECS